METQDRKLTIGSDPVKCSCRTNVCTRVKGRQGENTRGYCECRQNGTVCTYLCRCGQGKYACANTDPIEDDEDFYGKDSECDEQDYDEVLSVYYGEEEVSIQASDMLNTSLQELAVEQAELNASIIVAEHTPEVRGKNKIRRKRATKSVEVDRPEPVPDSTSTRTRSRQATSKAQRKADVERVTSMVRQLSPDGVQILVYRVAVLYPDLLEMAMEGDPPEPPHNTQPAGWCKCGHCREMPTAIERLCCIASQNHTCKLIEDAGAINQLVLSKTSLQAAVINHNEYCVVNDDPDDNDTLRHMAYRKYVLWRRGRLGAGQRVVIPSCMVWAIRNKYPSLDGTYTGFKPLIY